MATGFPVKANYATGDVLTAANMNDLSGTVNYLQYMPPRNPVLNSAFNVWQRGTNISLAASTSAGNGFTADRWQTYTGANQACTISRQATGDTINLPNIQYALRYQRNSGQTGTQLIYLAQNFESINSVPFAGKTVTLSFYARAGANFSAASSLLGVQIYTGTGTDQNVLSGYTGSILALNSSATLTTTWQRFTYTATLSSSLTELSPIFSWTPVGTAGANDYFEITGVQLELGSVANTYMPNQPTYQGELAACQRYFQSLNGSWGSYGATSSILANYYRHQVTMRTTPTITVTTAPSYTNASGLTNDENSVTGSRFYATITSTGGGFATNFIYSASAEL